jgi:hypothetical protein
MSHFTVAVITKDGDYEKALAPFDENVEVEKYIYKTREQQIEFLKDHEERFTDLDFTNDDTLIKSFLEKYGEDDCYDEQGNEWSTYNPDSKWDWYQVGGRWCGSLKLKHPIEQEVQSEPSIMSLMGNTQETMENLIDNLKTDHAQVKDIDFTPDVENVEKCKRFWEVVVEDSPLQEGEKEEDFRSFYNKKYYLEQYKDKETYIKEQTTFNTYAILYKGEWIEPNQMGWFGCSSADEGDYERYRKQRDEIMSSLKDEDWITVVDCHI